MLLKNKFKIILFVLYFIFLIIYLQFSTFIVVCADNKNDNVNMKFICLGQNVYYKDTYIKPLDHKMVVDFLDKKINANYFEKRKKLIENYKKYNDVKRSINELFPFFKNKVIKNIQKNFNKKAINSEIYFNPYKKNMFNITKEKNGVELNVDKLYNKFYEALSNNQKFVNVEFDTLLPKVYYNENNKLTNLRSCFETSFYSSGEGRSNNINIALNKINGTILENGEQFSFNSIVGQRNKNNGYKTAKIIMNGKYVDGVGGGICQVSTTLYNAALHAGMDIDEVHNHTLRPSYVKPALDAMVNEGSCDLKFTNNSGNKIFIKAISYNKNIKISFYGLPSEYKIVTKSYVKKIIKAPQKINFILDREQKYTTDKQVCILSKRKDGMECESYIYYLDKKSNRLLKKIKIRNCMYRSQQAVIAVNPPEDIDLNTFLEITSNLNN